MDEDQKKIVKMIEDEVTRQIKAQKIVVESAVSDFQESLMNAAVHFSIHTLSKKSEEAPAFTKAKAGIEAKRKKLIEARESHSLLVDFQEIIGDAVDGSDIRSRVVEFVYSERRKVNR